MNKEFILDKVREIIAQVLSIDIERVNNATNIMTDLDADSMDVASILMMVEEEFKVNIPEEETQKLLNIETIGTYIERKLKKSGL